MRRSIDLQRLNVKTRQNPLRITFLNQFEPLTPLTKDSEQGVIKDL